MLYTADDIYCSVFDSTVLRKNKSITAEREVSFFELELFLQDSGVSHINGKAYPARRGMLLCAQPGDKRYSDLPVKCRFIRIRPSGDNICKILSSFPKVIYIDDSKKFDSLAALMEKLSNYFISKGTDGFDMVTMNVLFLEILHGCMHLYKGAEENTEKPYASRRVRDAYEYINENFAGDCTLEKIAASVGITPNYLHVIFTRQIGITPFEYVTRKRVEQAKLLLMAGEKNMTEIALDLGFCSQSHFCKTFKNICGMTPTKYRENLVNRYTLTTDLEKCPGNFPGHFYGGDGEIRTRVRLPAN